MNPAQKFEEIEEMLGLACTWLDEARDQFDPYIQAAYDLQYAFREMISGNTDWDTCFRVKEQIEKNHPKVRL